MDDKSDVNEVCRHCLKWKQFQKNCYVWWEGKKVCTQQVQTPEQWEGEKQLMK